MKPHKFFTLTDPIQPDAIRVTSNISLRKAIRLTNGRSVPRRPVQFRVVDGSVLYDFVWSNLVIPRLVTDAVLRALRAAGMTGWSTYPVALAMDTPAVHPRVPLHGLAITGRVPRNSLEVDFTRSPSKIGFNSETWDGDDLFAPEGTAWIVATERVVRTLQAESVGNVLFQEVAELE